MHDTFVIQKEVHKQNFLEHINSVDPAIKFTVEDNNGDRIIPFLDTIVKPEASGRLSITVYRKPTYTYQYLQWDSHHHLPAKYSAIKTLIHRAKIVCNRPELLQKEMNHPSKALTWLIANVEKRLTKPTSEENNGVNNQGTTGTKPTINKIKTKGHIDIPYTQGLCESIKKVCGKHGIQTHFKGNSTIKNLLISPKDKDPMENKNGTIYWYQCGDLAY